MNEEHHNEQNSPRTSLKHWHRISIIATLVVIIIVGLFLLYPSPVEETGKAVPPKPRAPEPAEPTEPLEQPATPEERGDTAREIIQDLQDSEVVNYDEAFREARRFRDQGGLADAQLLYLFAARGGHARAAFELGGMYDPLHHSPKTSLMDEPDPFQAYKWYRQSRDAGHEPAGRRLSELQEWTQKAAGEGNSAAERLLMIWE